MTIFSEVMVILVEEAIRPPSGVDKKKQIGYSPRSGADKKKQIGYSPRRGADKRSSCVIRPAAWQIRDFILLSAPRLTM